MTRLKSQWIVGLGGAVVITAVSVFTSIADDGHEMMTPAQQHVLCENTARSIGGAPREIQILHIHNCMKADPAYGKGIATALGIPLSEVPR